MIATPLKGYGVLEATRLRHLTRRTANAPKTATDPPHTPSRFPLSRLLIGRNRVAAMQTLLSMLKAETPLSWQKKSSREMPY
jgi:hypothetical protein